MDEGYVLVVGAEEVPSELPEALGRAIAIRRCPAEPGVECPEVRGERCELRRNAKGTVVYLAGEHEFFGMGRWKCVTAGLKPTVVVLGGSDLDPRTSGGFAVVGSERGPEGVLAALADLFE